MPPSSRKIKDTSPPISLDPKEIRQHVRQLIRSLSTVPSRETPQRTRVILNEIWRLVEYAMFQFQQQEADRVLVTLQAVTDLCTTQGMYLNDFHSDVSHFFEDLASAWTFILLSIDLTIKDRSRWTRQIITWQTRLKGWSVSAVLDAPLAALREGWDDETLQAILQGTPLPSDVQEGEVPAYAPVLIRARLIVLEQRGQVQEYLRLAKAVGQIQEYVTMLVRRGQVDEAVQYALQQLATAEDALVVAQELVTHGEQASGLLIADHGLNLTGELVPLAIWLRDCSWSLGEHVLALKAGCVAFSHEPTLEYYLRIAEIAGSQWLEYREQLFDAARHAPWTADPQKLIRLFLHEHLFEDAIAVLQIKQPYTLVAEVVEAALAERTELEWVIKECHRQAEHIMNGAKAAYYQGAALWLTRARTAYHILGRDDVWDAYLKDLLERHKYKSKLLPFLAALVRED